MHNGFDAIQAIRKRPGMYVGGVGQFGVYHLVQELVSNSLDQFLAGRVKTISVSCNDECISVSDDGDGLPSNGGEADFTDWFMHFRDQPSATGHAPHVHLEPVGLGLIVLNALSSHLEVESIREGKQCRAVFSRGDLLHFETKPLEGERSGTFVRFVPDPGIFETSLPDLSFLRQKLFDAVHLVPGVRIHFNGESFYSEAGLIDLAQIFCGSETPFPRFNARINADDISVDVVAMGSRFGGTEQSIFSWANGSRTEEGGSHVKGFLAAIESSNKSGWTPSTLLINVTMQQPEFAGPSRGRLYVPGIESRIQELIQPEFEEFITSLPGIY